MQMPQRARRMALSFRAEKSTQRHTERAQRERTPRRSSLVMPAVSPIETRPAGPIH